METVPSTTPDLWSGHPIVDLVARQLRAFGDLTRDQAAEVLPYWAQYARLTEREVSAVLDRFTPTEQVSDLPVIPDGVTGYPIGGRR